MNKVIGVVIIALILAGGWYLFRGDGVEEIPKDDTISDVRVGENAIYVPDQKPNIVVTIGFADFAKGGYVVIHESSIGTPGTIIGNSAFLPEGESRNIIINISRESVDGEELFAMLHNDNGNGSFNVVQDLPTRNAERNIILMRFMISSDADAVIDII